MLKRKTEELDTEARNIRKAQESIAVLQGKVEFLTKPETANDIALQKQLDDCKKLLKCQSCHHNFKSHVLLKCMHTFWYLGLTQQRVY
jgi:E3 ubiquitin-protein ligase BRE1